MSCYIPFLGPQVTCWGQPSILETAKALQTPCLNLQGSCLVLSGVVCFVQSFPSKMKNLCLLPNSELM